VHCPYCRHADSRVIDSRTAEDGTSIRRRRQCPSCGRRFTTLETSSLTVVKRSGASEPFSRDKVVAGVRKACQGRPVSDDDLALLAQQVEEAVRGSGAAQIDAHEIGLAILGPLRQLDEVAYLRFASVYSSFGSLEDFEDAIAALRAERAAAGEAGGAGAADAAGTENENPPSPHGSGAPSASLGAADEPVQAPAH
jgi:transcriptional repressor NrdR